MQYGTIERELHIDAAPEIVFDVISQAEHLREWWPDQAEFASSPGSTGRIGFGNLAESITWAQLTVIDVVPPHRFSFRWTHGEGQTAAVDNSFLVSFELERVGRGTLLRMTESGFRERGWDAAKVAAEHVDHTTGWDHYLPRLPVYAARVDAGVRA